MVANCWKQVFIDFASKHQLHDKIQSWFHIFETFWKILQRTLHFQRMTLFEIPKLCVRKNYFRKMSYFFLFHMWKPCIIFCKPYDLYVLSKFELKVSDLHAPYYRQKNRKSLLSIFWSVKIACAGSHKNLFK